MDSRPLTSLIAFAFFAGCTGAEVGSEPEPDTTADAPPVADADAPPGDLDTSLEDDPSRADVLALPGPWPAASCPPEPDGGTAIGDALLDLRFTDCDGAEVRLHDLCGADVGLVYNLYGWCPPCWTFAREVPAHVEALADSLRMILVITEDPLTEPASAEYCSAVRAEYELDGVHVVRDPEGVFADAYGGTGTALVVDDWGRVVFHRDDASHDTIWRAVEAQAVR